MKVLRDAYVMIALLLFSVCGAAQQLATNESAPLVLVRIIPIPGVAGRVDHLAVDNNGGRVFAAMYGNDSVEVLDTARGRPQRTGRIHQAANWESQFLDAEYFMFEPSQAGSKEIRLGPYAARRVDWIVELLGDEGEKVVRGVRDDFAKSVGSNNWEDFSRTSLPTKRRPPASSWKAATWPAKY